MKLRYGTPQEAGISPEKAARIVEMTMDWVDEGLTTSLITLVARGGIIFNHEAFGRMRSAPDSAPISRDSIFGYASISKSFTATAVMLLVEQGRIGLNRPLQEYIPEFQGQAKDKVLVSHVLNHTSGLRDEDIQTTEQAPGEIDLPPPEPTEDPGEQEHLYHVYRTPLWRPPGTILRYCNSSYCLLGEIVRRVSGQSFDAFTRQRIFEALEMEDTYFSLPDVLRARVIAHPILEELDWDPIKQPGPPCCAYGTALDLARFGQTFLNGGHYGDMHLLSPAMVAAMTCDQAPGIPREPFPDGAPARQFGYGFFLINGDARGYKVPQLPSPQAYGHAGGSGAFLWVDPVYQIVGVFLFTSSGEIPYDLFIDSVTATIID